MTASKGGMAELTGLSRITFDYAIPEPWADRLRDLGIKHPVDWYVWAYPENGPEGPVNLAEEIVRYLAAATVDLGQVSEGLESQKDTSGFRVSLWDLLEWLKDSGLITEPARPAKEAKV
jgi:hypothetical protein